MRLLPKLFILSFLVSCSSFKEKTGLVKYQPDEYQVETNTSLDVPPNFNVLSPEELIAKKNQTSNESNANLSKGENAILQNMDQQ